MKVPVYSIAGFEADDVVGTLCNKCQITNAKCQITVVTGDKDYMQLVNDNVSLYMPQKGLSDGIVIDRDKVKEKLGVWPEQVIDYKALAGDSSDNYPGVTGIGPKTAVSLLEAFGSFEEIYKQITNTKSQVPNKFQISKSQIEKLINGYEGGELSKRLATIKRDVPLSLEIDQCKVPSLEEITKIFKELGYGSLIKRVSGEDVKIDDTQSRLFDL
jgi:DNA polymerase-1